jgi:hypothetical protein
MTTQKDLIDRFAAEAQKYKRLALVVILGDEATLMWNDGPNLRIRLNSYIEAGGLPIGTIGYDAGQYEVKVLDELADIPSVRKQLSALLYTVKAEWMGSQRKV